MSSTFFSLDETQAWTLMSIRAMPIATNVWYHFEVDLNWSLRTFTVRVNDTPLGMVHSHATSEGVLRIDLFNTSVGTSEFDEIELWP
jgi:hypothetical protein